MQPPAPPGLELGRPFKRGGTDRSVQGTNDDAQLSKLSCVNLGYFRDDFVKFFVRKPTRRPPLINRGYYSRVAALKDLVMQFLRNEADENSQAPVQILTIGAGYDTLYFMLKAAGNAPQRFYEVDFPVVTKSKASIISSNPALREMLDSEAKINRDDGTIDSEGYCLMAADLRDLPTFTSKLEGAGFDFRVPTLILSECVLVYMEPHFSRELVSWAGKEMRDAVFIVYEQIHPEDAFGQQMILNLESRGCPLKGLNDTPNLEAQKQRFLGSGWSWAEAFSMNDVYNRFLDKAELRRIERLEIFDEFEEWHLIQGHYCIAYGVNDSQGRFKEFGFKEAAPLQIPVSLGRRDHQGIRPPGNAPLP